MLRLPRLLFIAVLLVLLPMRGWAGNVMSVDMAVTSVLQAKIASTASLTQMPADCAMYSQAPLDDASTYCSSCDTCEMCLAVANLTPATWSANRPARQPGLLAFNASFNSATSTSNLKPPIA